jgi:hypothetical protein
MFLALVAMISGSWAGFLRLGWSWPTLQPGLFIAHGPLMVSGFLGTLIGVERAVALGHRWVYIGPIFTALGGLLLVVGIPGLAGPILITSGSVFMVLVFALNFKRITAFFTIVMGIGASCWMIGNLLWITGTPIFQVVMWWAGFLVLTIAGERLELSRILDIPRVAHLLFLSSIGLFLGGLVVSLVQFDLGVRLTGVGMSMLGLWLYKYDVASRTVKKPGLTRYIAVCLLVANFWLVVAGVMAVLFGGVVVGPRYDAMIHALFLGFVFSMIFGHAPIIFPAILKVNPFFNPIFYIHFGLLHISLVYRVVGNLSNFIPGRMWGGLLNGVAILLFLVFTAVMVVQAKRDSPSSLTVKQ